MRVVFFVHRYTFVLNFLVGSGVGALPMAGGSYQAFPHAFLLITVIVH